MRKILRSIARANMRRAGIKKMNKPRFMVRGGVLAKVPSFFAENWRNWL